jgi:hypothetical protein
MASFHGSDVGADILVRLNVAQTQKGIAHLRRDCGTGLGNFDRGRAWLPFVLKSPCVSTRGERELNFCGGGRESPGWIE